MRIDFSLVNPNPDVDIEKTSKSAAGSHKTGTTSGYRLDISGTVMDNAAYGKKGRSARDIMQDAGRQDVALQRNYMAVMSNSMSAGDFEKLKEEGYQPGQIPADQVVTVLDRIKAAMAEAGIRIEGFTDDLSAEKLEKITGSKARAREIASKLEEEDTPATEENVEAVSRALKQAKELGPMTEGAAKYLVENNLEPTIDNLYTAQFSGAANTDRQAHGYYDAGTQGYLAKKAEDFNWDQLKEQINPIIEDAGLKADEETVADAEWLIEKGVPLTEESIALLERIKGADLPVDPEAALTAAVTAVANGKEAGQASLTGEEDLKQKAARIMETVAGLTDEALEKTVMDGLEATIETIGETQESSREASQNKTDTAGNSRGKSQGNQETSQSDREAAQVYVQGSGASEEQRYRVLTAQRQFQEVRLQMTVEANLKLLRSGYSIETAGLKELVEQLKAAEKQCYEKLFGQTAKNIEGKIGLYKETSAKLDGLRSLPAAVLGRYLTEEELFTIDSVHKNGSALKSTYDKAGIAYETLMTSPRPDMGDSIRKAFRNVDDILRDMDLEVNRSNERAVRILGYNSMEINEENIAKVKASDQEVRMLMNRMTPAVTLRMIRDGIDPLNTDIGTLNDEAKRLQEETGAGMEKYSEFLWKLDKKNEVTKEERESYIGIYRLLHQIEKSDGAVIGSVLNQNAELNLKNLLTASRNVRSRGMDVKLDENFGELQELRESGESISDQIAKGYEGDSAAVRYYSQVAEEALNTLKDPSMMQQIGVTMDTGLEALRDALRDGSRESDPAQDGSKEYDRVQAQRLRDAAKAEDSLIRALLDNRQDVSADNLAAVRNLLSDRGGAFKRLFETAQKSDKREKTRTNDSLREAMINVQEGLESEESAKDAYEELTAAALEVVEAAVYGSDATSLDVREMQLLHKTISLAGNFAREENYEVPVEINGELTSINLKIQHDGPNGGQVAAFMDTQDCGAVSARFYVKDGEVRGYAVCSSGEGVGFLEKRADGMAKDLENDGLRIAEFQVIQSDTPEVNPLAADSRAGGEGTSTTTLYSLAKAFISAVQKQE